jgi:hypothetical protein
MDILGTESRGTTRMVKRRTETFAAKYSRKIINNIWRKITEASYLIRQDTRQGVTCDTCSLPGVKKSERDENAQPPTEDLTEREILRRRSLRLLRYITPTIIPP